VIGSAGTSGVVLYARTGGGFFKSVDAGLNWTPFYLIEPGLAQPTATGFAVDPHIDSTLYLRSSNATGGIWKSTDAGATWAVTNSGLTTTGAGSFSSLTIPPGNPSRLYVRQQSFVYKSIDRGATWARVGAALPNATGSLNINRSNPSIMYFATGEQVWKSANEGATWNFSASLQVFQDRSTGAMCIESDPTFPNLVYVCVTGPLQSVGNQAVNGVHRSTDGAASFQPPTPRPALIQITGDMLVDSTGGQNVFTLQSAGGYCKSQDRAATFRCPADTIFGAGLTPTFSRLSYLDPKNGSLLYGTASRASVELLLRSRDAGETWQEIAGRAKPTLSKPPQPIVLQLSKGNTSTVSITVNCVDLPTAAIPFTVTTTESWIAPSIVAGNTPATLRLTIQAAAGLEPGQSYDTVVRIASPQAYNEFVNIPVRLTIPAPVSGMPAAYTVTNFAGNGNTTLSGDGGPAAEAGIGQVTVLAVDQNRNVYFAASTHHRVRKIDSDGRIATVAGTGTQGSAGDGGSALHALLNQPRGLAVDKQGALLVVDSTYALRRVVNGVISTIVARTVFGLPSQLAMDAQDRLWILDLNRAFRYVPPSTATVLATPGTTFSALADLAFDASGNMYVADSRNGRVYRVTASGVVTPYAGNGSTTGSTADGVPAVSTRVDGPMGLAADSRGNLFIVEATSRRVRVVTPAGIIFTIANLSDLATAGDMAVDSDGNLYVAAQNYIRKLTPPPAAAAPRITGGPRNVVSQSEVVAPGGLFYVEGEGLAAGEETVQYPPWPEALAGASANVNGWLVPLNQAGPSRLSGQIPWRVEPGDANLTVTVNAVTSDPRLFRMAAAAPGIFVTEEGRAIDSTVSNGIATVLVTGFGALDAPIESGGTIAALPFTAKVGEKDADAVDIMLVPGMIEWEGPPSVCLPGWLRATIPLRSRWKEWYQT